MLGPGPNNAYHTRMLRRALTCLAALALVAAGAHAAPRAAWERARTIITRPDLTRGELETAARDSEAAVRKAALIRIHETGDSRLQDLALERLTDPVWSVRRLAAVTLESIGTSDARVPLEVAAEHDPNPEVVSRALGALGAVGDSRSWPIVESSLDNAAFIVRGLAAQTAGDLDYRGASETLRRLEQNDPTEYVRFRAAGALRSFQSGTPSPHRPTPPLVNGRQAPILALGIIMLLLCVFLIHALVRRKRARATFIGATLAALLAGLWLTNTTSQPPRRIVLRCDDALFDLWPHLSPDAAPGLCSELADAVRSRGIDVILDPAPVNALIGSKRNAIRKQIDAPSLLATFREMRGEDGLAVITGQDLAQEPFYYVMGLGDRGVSIISLHRIDPVFLEEGRGDAADLAIYRERAERLVLHEVGHMFGLPHCTHARCVMNYFESADEYFRVDADFCAACAARIKIGSR
jgi:archaemetzincin